jgi:hypothetical protein
MKKITTFLLFAIVVGTVFQKMAYGQVTTFKEEAVTDVKIQGDKVYFYKQIISDKVLCADAGASCVIGRTTTLNAEIFQMNEIIYRYKNELSKRSLIELYNTGIVPTFRVVEDGRTHVKSTEKDYSSPFYFKEQFFVKLEKPVPQFGFMFSFENYYKLQPTINKTTNLIAAERVDDFVFYFNFIMLGFVFWFLALFFGLAGLRRYKSFDMYDQKDYYRETGSWKDESMTSFGWSDFFGLASAASFAIGLLVFNKNIGWGLITILPFTLSLISAILKVPRRRNIDIWSKEWIYNIENLILLCCLLIILVRSGDFAWGNAVCSTFICWSAVFISLMFLMSFRLYKKQHGVTLYEKYFKNIFSKEPASSNPVDATAGSEILDK